MTTQSATTTRLRTTRTATDTRATATWTTTSEATSSTDATIEWTTTGRDPRRLWRLAGFGDRFQALWFVVYAVRPPLVSNSAVPVVAQLTTPLSTGRRVFAVGGPARRRRRHRSDPAVASCRRCGGPSSSSSRWRRASRLERCTVASTPDHVRLHDIVASERHSGDGERSLRSLLRGVDQGVELGRRNRSARPRRHVRAARIR